MKKLCLVLLCVAAAGGVYAEGGDRVGHLKQLRFLLYEDIRMYPELNSVLEYSYTIPLYYILTSAISSFEDGDYATAIVNETKCRITRVRDIMVTDMSWKHGTLLTFGIDFPDETEAADFYTSNRSRFLAAGGEALQNTPYKTVELHRPNASCFFALRKNTPFRVTISIRTDTPFIE